MQIPLKHSPLWLALRFPQLPLEALQVNAPLTNTFDEQNNKQPHKSNPQVVVDKERLLCVDKQASVCGLQVGQSLAKAYALCSELTPLTRKPLQEKQKLANLALLFSHFTPALLIEGEDVLLLELSASLRLDNGLKN